jgi:DNA-binding CsgD family transcriptional regulator
MDPLDLMQSFVEQCEQPLSQPELAATFERALADMGFRYFACCAHVNPGNPPSGAIVLHNYPDAWARSYIERKLHECDPVFHHAERTILPFSWDAPDFRAALTPTHHQILKEAASLGIASGYTVPIHLPWAAGALRASCSVVPDSARIGSDAYRAVQVMSMYLYATAGHKEDVMAVKNSAAGTAALLSARERQCLELAACGKSDWAISQLLNISEHTVHKHIEAAKRRLGVATRVQAIVWAAYRHEISLVDVIRAEQTNKRAT